MLSNFADGFGEGSEDTGVMRAKALTTVKTFKLIKKAIW